MGGNTTIAILWILAAALLPALQTLAQPLNSHAQAQFGFSCRARSIRASPSSN